MTGLLKENQNCYKRSRAQRCAFLIDGENYFAALHQTLKKANSSIYISGWDIHSRTKLVRGGQKEEPEELLELLKDLTSRKKGLKVKILLWDYTTLFLADRELLPELKFEQNASHRIDLELDDKHPFGASHHEKIVVIDDKMAFCGGLDLTARRWDTREHKPKLKERKDPSGKEYNPFHDHMLFVQGDCAKHLGELFRERWKRATGKDIEPPDEKPDKESDVFDESLSSGILHDVEVSIARTRGSFKAYPEIREIEKAYIDLIDSAEDLVFIENQYLTSEAVCDAIEVSIKKEKGPRIIVLLPERWGSWLEEKIMWAMRKRKIIELRKADKGGRLELYTCKLAGGKRNVLKIHSKIMTVDNRYVMIGSANLSNRSMGLDTECNLIVDCSNDEQKQKVVNRFRADLLAEHSGMPADKFDLENLKNGPLSKILQGQENKSRFIEEIEPVEPDDLDEIISESRLGDWEKPISVENFLDEFVYRSDSDNGRVNLRRVLTAIGTLTGIIIVALALVIFFGSGDYYGTDKLREIFSYAELSDITFPLVILIYVVAGLLFMPLSLLIGATVFAFEGTEAFIYILIGTLAGALSGFSVGLLLGKDIISKLFGLKFKRLSQKFSNRSLLPLSVLRLLPITPFSLENLVCGALKINILHFLAATLIGILPGAVSLVMFKKSLVAALSEPSLLNIAVAVFIVAIIFVLGWVLKKRFS